MFFLQHKIILYKIIILFLVITIGLSFGFILFIFSHYLFLIPQERTSANIIINANSFLATSTNSISNLSVVIPPHIDLFDFYKTYGTRLLGNNDLKIISREEWGVDNNICQKEKCLETPYDPEDSFSPWDYFKLKMIINNYRNNFQQFEEMFLQTKTQINGMIYTYLPMEEIIIHHTAGKFTTDFEESKKELQRIYFLHTVKRGWGDIAYHFLIDGAGRIYEGTLGGKYSNGGHTYWHNNGTIGIALMGDFRPGHDTFTKPMQESLIKLIKYLIQEYHWNINNQQFYLKKPDLSGREWSRLIIKGHQELDLKTTKTQCPGIDPEELRKLIYPAIFESNFESDS